MLAPPFRLFLGFVKSCDAIEGGFLEQQTLKRHLAQQRRPGRRYWSGWRANCLCHRFGRILCRKHDRRSSDWSTRCQSSLAGHRSDDCVGGFWSIFSLYPGKIQITKSNQNTMKKQIPEIVLMALLLVGSILPCLLTS